jgi:hypothetical protein
LLPISYGKENYTLVDIIRVIVAAKSASVKRDYFDNKKKKPKIGTS